MADRLLRATATERGLDRHWFVVRARKTTPTDVRAELEDLDLEARSADLIVQKNFFHYRMFYLTTSFQHIPVVSAGASSLTRIREQDYSVPMEPKSSIADWRPSDPILRRPSVDEHQGDRAAARTSASN